MKAWYSHTNRNTESIRVQLDREAYNKLFSTADFSERRVLISFSEEGVILRASREGREMNLQGLVRTEDRLTIGCNLLPPIALGQPISGNAEVEPFFGDLGQVLIPFPAKDHIRPQRRTRQVAASELAKAQALANRAEVIILLDGLPTRFDISAGEALRLVKLLSTGEVPEVERI